jgi:hypothetical protein
MVTRNVLLGYYECMTWLPGIYYMVTRSVLHGYQECITLLLGVYYMVNMSVLHGHHECITWLLGVYYMVTRSVLHGHQEYIAWFHMYLFRLHSFLRMCVNAQLDYGRRTRRKFVYMFKLSGLQCVLFVYRNRKYTSLHHCD